ncbi:MAG: hypothetical protein AB7F96_11030 [Beijerinckiaceae bacterium]
MAITIDRDVLTVCSRYACVQWIFHATFPLVFPPAILAMWRAGPDQLPLWFTLLFLAAVPFLLNEIARARLVRATLDRMNGTVEVQRRGLIVLSQLAGTFDDIDRVEMRTTDNDGEFHRLFVVFRDGSDFEFRHGNCRQAMEAERGRLREFLHVRRCDLTAVEKFVA